MATLTSQSIDRDGLNPSYAAAAAGGDKLTPSKHTFLHIKNGDASEHTVTVATPGDVVGLAVADVSVAVPAGEERLIGPFPHEHFADPSDGLAAITYTAVTSITVAALELSQP